MWGGKQLYRFVLDQTHDQLYRHVLIESHNSDSIFTQVKTDLKMFLTWMNEKEPYLIAGFVGEDIKDVTKLIEKHKLFEAECIKKENESGRQKILQCLCIWTLGSLDKSCDI